MEDFQVTQFTQSDNKVGTTNNLGDPDIYKLKTSLEEFHVTQFTKSESCWDNELFG